MVIRNIQTRIETKRRITVKRTLWYVGKQSDVMTTDHEVKIVNSKDVDSTTGIFMDYMPYILVVVIAGVFGVFFLRGRKRKIDEI